MNNMYRLIPNVDEFLKDSRLKIYKGLITYEKYLNIIRNELDNFRECIKKNKIKENLKKEEIYEEIVKKIICNIKKNNRNEIKRVINGTGIIMHTNLGRAVLSEKVAKSVYDVSIGYSNLEYNLEKGSRGSRMDYVEEILKDLTGCQSALVVNNNASAVYLILNTLGLDKEVVVSRGELVEIGGSFRISEIVEQSGGIIKEVGTTNKTNLKDYEKGTSQNTSIYLKVHRSNFKIIGFTEEVSTKELVKAKKNEIIVVEDMGSGVLFDMETLGLKKERTVNEALDDGVDIVCFSGDKLLGGSQSGIILGKKELIDKMKENQMLRCLRVDKMTLVALMGTLKEYLESDSIKNIPTYKFALKTKKELLDTGKKIIEEINNSNIKLEIKDHLSMFGGGSMPQESMEGLGIFIKPLNKTIREVEEQLRNAEVPIITIIKNDEIIINLTTLFDRDINLIVKTLNNI